MSKISIERSTSGLNSIDIVISDESHTVAAPLVERMNLNSNCLFSAYKIGHPADDFVNLRVQGNENKNAKDIFLEGIQSILEDLEDISTQLKKGTE
jgi:DNA-directed RNA polymerase II subunit RPB11